MKEIGEIDLGKRVKEKNWGKYLGKRSWSLESLSMSLLAVVQETILNGDI